MACFWIEHFLSAALRRCARRRRRRCFSDCGNQRQVQKIFLPHCCVYQIKILLTISRMLMHASVYILNENKATEIKKINRSGEKEALLLL